MLKSVERKLKKNLHSTSKMTHFREFSWSCLNIFYSFSSRNFDWLFFNYQWQDFDILMVSLQANFFWIFMILSQTISYIFPTFLWFFFEKFSLNFHYFVWPICNNISGISVIFSNEIWFDFHDFVSTIIANFPTFPWFFWQWAIKNKLLTYP